MPIEGQRYRQVRITHGKGGVDRDVPLSPRLLETLREYWRWMRPKTYLFPGTENGWRTDKPITDLTGDFCTSWIETGRQKGTGKMPRKTFTPEQIVGKLRQIEVLLSQGKTVPVACKEVGIVEQTFYRWRKEFGGLQMEQAKKLKELQRENTQLRRAVADLTVEKQILKDVAEGNF